MQSMLPLTLSCFMLSRFYRVQLFATPWTVACQAPLSVGFFRQEYWSGLPEYCSVLPCPPPGDLSNPGMEPMCLLSPALADRLGSLPLAPPGKRS